MAGSQCFFSLLLVFWASGAIYAQHAIRTVGAKNGDQIEEAIGLRILTACAKVEIDNPGRKVLIDERAPVQVLINGKMAPSSPSGLYLKLASIKIDDIERIDLQPATGRLRSDGLMLNFVLRK